MRSLVISLSYSFSSPSTRRAAEGADCAATAPRTPCGKLQRVQVERLADRGDVAEPELKAALQHAAQVHADAPLDHAPLQLPPAHHGQVDQGHQHLSCPLDLGDGVHSPPSPCADSGSSP